MRVSHLFLILDSLLFASAFHFSEQGESAAAVAVLVFAGIAIGWQIYLFASLPAPTQMLHVKQSIRKPHVIQALLQVCIYIYLSLYWKGPERFAFFIVVQILCAYTLESLLSLSRRKVWHFGFGPLPIVLSLNLFIWFKNEYFALQILMVALTYFAKEFFTWTRDGRKRHIFNPSGFALTVVAFALLFSGSTDTYTIGVDLVESFELPPNFYELIFVLGLVVQFFFLTTPMTFGAVLSHFALFFAVSWMLGGRAGAFPIDKSVFLAMTLLIPDPATTPRSATGKFLFGVLYGVSILGIAIGLKYLQQPDYYSKILIIPFLNLLTPWFDRIAPRRQTVTAAAAPLSRSLRSNLSGILVYSCLFFAIIGSLKQTRSTQLGRPWLQPVAVASEEMGNLIFNMMIARNILPQVYKPFGFVAEADHYGLLRKIYSNELSIEELDKLYLDSIATNERK